MPRRSLKFHVSRLAALTLLTVLLLTITGYSGLFVAVLLGAYLCWSLYNTFKLNQWLYGNEEEPPESYGVWAEIFDQINILQSKNRDQRQQNLAIIDEFRGMTDAFPDATLVLDSQECITWFNPAATELLGLRKTDDIGQRVTNLLRDPDFAGWMAVEEQVESSFQMPSPIDSTKMLSINMVRFREDQKLLILRDISDIHNLEKVRRDFVANVSHELRTPLTVLLGYLEGLDEHCEEDLVPAVTRMQQQAHQMQELLNDLLELSRLQASEPEKGQETVDVPAMLMQLKEQAEELSQGSHQLEFDLDQDLRLTGTSADLESAFRNLINNAINYTPDGGKIQVSWQRQDRGPVFTVKDSGIGIPKRDIPRLTERFYRVGSDRSRHSGGTGLGLAIVKHVLNTHDAALEISSELGEGSTFMCIFPDNRVAAHGQSSY